MKYIFQNRSRPNAGQPPSPPSEQGQLHSVSICTHPLLCIQHSAWHIWPCEPPTWREVPCVHLLPPNFPGGPTLLQAHLEQDKLHWEEKWAGSPAWHQWRSICEPPWLFWKSASQRCWSCHPRRMCKNETFSFSFLSFLLKFTPQDQKGFYI